MRIILIFIMTLALRALAQNLQQAHLRVKTTSGAEFGWIDTTKNAFLTFKIEEISVAEGYNNIPVEFSTPDTAGIVYIPVDKKLRTLSAVYRSTERGQSVTLGENSPQTVLEIPIPEFSSNIMSVNNRKAQKLRDDKKISVNLPQYSSITNMEALEDCLEQSADPNEGFWCYFDRNTSPLKSRLGGKYTLATLRNGDKYEIIYLAGSENDQWSPLNIKGYLNETPIEGHFDLIWYGSDFMPIDYETSATIENGLLSCFFPYWDTTVRFIKTQIDKETLR